MSSVETKVYSADDVKALRAKAVSSANAIATHARLLDPLPPGQDLSNSEFNGVAIEHEKINSLPRHESAVMHAAFSAGYIHKLYQRLLKLSLENQRKTVTIYISILSAFPEPAYDPYQRMFLCSPKSRGITNFVTVAFLEGLEQRFKVPPGRVCRFITELLHWRDTQEGDDKKSSMDSDLRKRLLSRTEELMRLHQWHDWSDFDQRAIKRLNNALRSIDSAPDDMYLSAVKSCLLEMARVGLCGNDLCPLGKEPLKDSKRCSRCRGVTYCGEKCQKQHWQNEHKFRCFARVD